MALLISMNNGENFTFDITEENYKTFKIDTSICESIRTNAPVNK